MRKQQQMCEQMKRMDEDAGRCAKMLNGTGILADFCRNWEISETELNRSLAALKS